jgi:hypothetical protein
MNKILCNKINELQWWIMIMIIYSKNINLRTAEIDDAEFVFNMKQNPNRVRYLTKITGTVESQREWIKIVSRGEKKEKNITL